MKSADIEPLERATVAAVGAREVLEFDGWLVPLENGSIGRSRAAVPLSHDLGPSAVTRIEAAYRNRGLRPQFRIAEVSGLDAVRAELQGRGYAASSPTIFEIGDVDHLVMISAASARILEAPDDAWAAVFLGEGFDPADGEYRVASLRRSPDAAYGAAGEGGATHAVGVMSFGYGFAGVHGMRTAPVHRGRGYAAAILATLGCEARARGYDRVFLQVEEANPARRIYRRAGFQPAWRYQYWKQA